MARLSSRRPAARQWSLLCDIDRESEIQRMWLTIAVLSLLSDVPPRRIAPSPPECRQDSDCVISTFQGCCPGCCEAAPRAVKKGTKEGEICIAMMCERPDCSAVRCARPEPHVAVCRANRCVAVPTKEPQPAECAKASDCRVIERPTADGCCTTRVAAPNGTSTPLTKKPKYGLTAPAGACAPCPPAEGGEAACEANRCVLRRPTE